VYTVSLVAGNGSGPGSTASQAVTIAAQPTISFGATPTIACIGDPLTISATGAPAYTWEPGTVTTPQFSLVVANNLSYTVSGMNAQGCKSTAFLDITADPCLGSARPQTNGDVTLYPNPAHTSVLVRSRGESFLIKEIECSDASGRVIHSQQVNGSRKLHEVPVDISAWSPGVYHVKVRAEDGKSVLLRLLKE
jgi:hypothetical protein